MASKGIPYSVIYADSFYGRAGLPASQPASATASATCLKIKNTIQHEKATCYLFFYPSSFYPLKTYLYLESV